MVATVWGLWGGLRKLLHLPIKSGVSERTHLWGSGAETLFCCDAVKLLARPRASSLLSEITTCKDIRIWGSDVEDF
jgi:hypothetical protein